MKIEILKPKPGYYHSWNNGPLGGWGYGGPMTFEQLQQSAKDIRSNGRGHTKINAFQILESGEKKEISI